MIEDNRIYVGKNEEGEKICLMPKLANRHGLVAGATGTGKTVTLRVLAESFSELGIPVFMADVKGDLAGMADAGMETDAIRERIEAFGLDKEGFTYSGYPVVLWDIFGEKGIPLRTTISEMGPLLLARLMDLNDLQSDLLTIAFKIADDHNLLLYDTKDLKALLNYISENHSGFEADYGKMSPTSIAAIVRAVVSLEIAGGETFFGETALNVMDWFSVDRSGRGTIHILDSASLISNGKMYSTFLLWLLSELFERLPEVGDLDKPKMVFFFDEAHLLFKDAPSVLVEKVEQVVKLIRSKGVGVYFCTQNPRDIPDGVLAQLSNRIQHALHAYTPADQKSVRAAADSFRTNPSFNTYDTIMALGIGEAVISFLEESGAPGIAQKVKILPPRSRLGSIDEAERSARIRESLLFSKYEKSFDPDSAYEFLMRMGLEQQAKEEEKKEAAKKTQAGNKAARRAVKSVGNTVAGTIGREVGKTAMSGMGSFGKRLGGNAGASIARGLFSTLFKG